MRPTRPLGRVGHHLTRAVVMLLVLGTSACAAPPPPSPPPEAGRTHRTVPAPDTAACPPPGLRVAAGPVEAAMGLRVVVLRMENCGTTAYALKGYPTLALLDEDGEELSFTTRHGGGSVVDDPGPRRLVMQPGSSAQAAVTWRNTVTSGDAVTGKTLAITPVPGAMPQRLELTVDLGTTAGLDLTAWQQGTPTSRR